MDRPPLPTTFRPETAAQKVRMAEDGWNTRDPARCGAGLYGRQPAGATALNFSKGRDAI